MSYIAYLDCHAGIDGNTLLATLLDAGLSLDTLKQSLALFPRQEYNISLQHVVDAGVRGSHLTITSTILERESYNWLDIEAILSSAQLSTYIRDTTLKILRRIADAEAIVRDDGTDYQAFHIPASDLLSILDIVIGLKELGITQLYASVLPLTSINTNASYSQSAMVSSVVLEILRPTNALWKPTSIESQQVTPVGAALLATLARFDTPTMTIERVGHGFTIQVPSEGNSLHLYLGESQEPVQQDEDDADIDWVSVLSTNIDNMSGEIVGGLMDRLLAAGALDVSFTPMQMKKNRPAILLMVICPLEKGNELAYILLGETTTLGVRMQQVQRLKAQRTQQQIDTPLGSVLVKVKRLGSQIISASPEYEECQRLALEHNMPLTDVYRITQQWIANTLFNGHVKSEDI